MAERRTWARLAHLRSLPLLISLALISSLLCVVVTPTPAYAAGTTLFQNKFDNRTVDGTGTVTVPTPVNGANRVCLTARGNSSTGPLYSCPSTTDFQGSGKLRLTTAATNQIGGVFGATSFPTSNGLDVTFTTYQYGGGGADGMSFVLAAVDPANPAAPTTIGPGGGSLGYSTNEGVVGLKNAYLGVGLDVYGNFSSTDFQGSGCSANSRISTQVPGAVVVRGPGSGTVGYCGLDTTYTGSSASRLSLRASTRTASAVPVQVLINPGTTSFTSDSGVSVAPGTYKVVVDPVGSGGAKTLTGDLPTVSSGLYPSSNWLTAAGVPKQLAFGFIGSTGGVTDYHEASNVKVVTFASVPQLAVSGTSYVASSPQPGDPVNYVVTPSVQAGVGVDQPVSMTQTTPSGVTPVGAFGSGWTCEPPSDQTITCTTTATSFAAGSTLPPVNVVAVVTGSSVSASTVRNGSTSAVSAESANPANDTEMNAGTLPTAPSGLTLTPASGPVGGGGSVTIKGTNLTAATAVEIGTAAEQRAGTSTVLLPCSSVITTDCFTVSGSNLVVASWPGRSGVAAASVTVVTLGVADTATYTYAGRPDAPATPTAVPGQTRATVSWSAPAANGSTITGYLVTPHLGGVAQAPINYDASTTTRTLTGLTAGGSYTFTVAAINGYGTSPPSPKSAAVVPYTVPAAPTITSSSPGDAAATLTWSAPASNGSPITGYVVTPYVGATAQNPVSFDGTGTTATLTGLTPGTSYTFTVAAVNAAGTGPASAKSTAVVPNALPTLTFTPPPAGEVGVSYSHRLTVNDGTAPFTWSVSSGSLPTGLTLNGSTGVLSGTPTTAGSFTFTARVTDASGQSATRSITLVVAAAPSLTFTPAAGEVSVAYRDQPTLSGGTGPFGWAVTAGSLPAGVTLDPATGLLSGTPTASGTFSVTLTVTDSLGVTATKTGSIGIAALPRFSFSGPASGQVSVPYNAALDVTGGTKPLTWSIAAGSLPAGLALNASTGVLSGAPTTAGTSTFTVAVVDAFDQRTTRAVTLTIDPGPLVITKTANVSSVVAGGRVAYTITVANTGTTTRTGVSFVDPLDDVLDDASFNNDVTASTGTINFDGSTPTWAGTLGAGATATLTYSVTVANPVTGNQVLANTVTSTTLGTNCGAGSADSRCTATVTVSGLRIVKTADVATTTPGSTVRFTVVATNTGRTPYVGATFTDPLAGVLDDARYNGNGSATSGSLNYAGSTLTWTGNLAVGQSATLSYTVTVSEPDPGDRRLSGTVVSPTAGSVCPGGNPAASCTATVTVLVPALSIETASTASTTTPGGQVPYTVTLSNTGQTAYPTASVDVDLGGTVDDTGYDGNATASAGNVSYAAGSGTLTWTGDLAVGAVVTITFSVTVDNPDRGDRTLRTVASSTAAGSTCPPGSSNPACASTVSVLVPALTIATSADVSSSTPGSIVTFTVSVTNSGQTPYTGASFRDDLTGVLDDATLNGTPTATAGTVSYADAILTWTDDLAVGASTTITYAVTVRDPDPGDRSLRSRITSDTPFNNCAPGSPDQRCTGAVAVLIPALALKISADPATTTPGQVVHYSVTATNTGQSAYRGVAVVADQAGVLDDAQYDADASASSGSLSVAAGGDVSWLLDLAVGATATATWTVTVADPVAGDRSLVALLSSGAAGSSCPTSSADAGCRSTVPVLRPGLVITKVADRSTVEPGGSVGYTISVTNTGETTQTGATVTDSLAQVLTDAAYNADATATLGAVSYAVPTLTWTGTLAVGASATVRYSVTVSDPDPGDKRLTNTITSAAAGSNCPAGGTDPRCTASVDVLVPALTVTKSASTSHTAPGQTVKYTVKVTNSGATDYPAANWADSLTGVLDDAAYHDDAQASAGDVSYAGSTLRWTGPLAVGASATITYTVTVHQAAGGDNLLDNTVISTSKGSNCGSGSGDVRCSVVVPVARLVIEQAYVESSTTPGSVVHLAASFTNTGQYPYTGITISSPSADTVDDAIPTGDQTASSGSLVLSSSAITWTGNIGVGETVMVTGTLTVADPDTGDRVLRGTLVSAAVGSNCGPGSADARCTARLPVLIPQLSLTKTADSTFVVPGGTATYTITVANTGQTPYAGASVSDSLVGVVDDGSYNGDAVASSGSVSYAGSTLTWTGDLAVGASVTIGYTVTAHPVGTGGDKTMANRVNSSAVGSTCPTASGNPACRATVAVLTPALTVVSGASLSSAVPGDTVTFTVVATNTGQVPYTGATVDVPLADVLDDAGYADDATASRGSVALVGTSLRWTGALGVGASATLSYSVVVDDPVTGNFNLDQTVTSTTQGSSCPAGGSDPRCSSQVPIAGLRIVNSVDVSTTQPTGVVHYTGTFTNTGRVPYFGLTVTDSFVDTLDDATYDGDATATSGSLIVVVGSGRIVWTGDLPVGATVTITGSVTVANPDLGNQTLATSISTDASGSNCPVGGNDPRCSTSVSVLTPRLSITQAANTATATPGRVVTYTTTAANTGQTPYAGATVTDLLGGALDDATYVDATASTGAVTFGGTGLAWTGDLAIGQTVTITFRLRVDDPDLGDKALITTVASDEIGSSCPTGTDDPACTSTVTVLVPALDLTLTADASTTTPGSTVGYTVTIANRGQTPYAGASVDVALAGALDDATYAGDAVATSGTVDHTGDTLRWTGDLAVGGTAVLTYHLVVADPDPGNRKLTTSISSTAPGSNCGPESVCASTVTVLIPALTITTTADRSTATPGDRVSFTLTVANTGQTAYPNATVTTSLAGVIDDASFDGTARASTGTVRYDAPMLSWSGSLPSGATVTITYTVTVRAELGDHRLSSTAVSTDPGSNCPPAGTNPTCTATATVLVPSLAIAKTADQPTTVPGGTVGYTIVVTNDGETPYPTATVTDDLADLLSDGRYNGDATVTGGGVVSYDAPRLGWAGNLPVGASATIRYSITVDDPVGGDRQLTNRVVSTVRGSSCPAGGTSPACSVSVQVLVPALEIAKTPDTASVVAGDDVHYTLTVTNTGQTLYAPATVTDNLTGVLDDASYLGDAVATVGTVDYANNTLVWSGPLGIGDTATITYSVRTAFPADGDHTLDNAAVSNSAGATCGPGDGDARCRSEVTVLVPALTVTKSADTSRVVAGGTVSYTIAVSNPGEADYPAATVTDDLSGVLDDAGDAGDVTASAGTVGYEAGTLTWTGAVARGETVLITYSVTTHATGGGDGRLDNRVTSPAVGSTCPVAGGGAWCATSTAVEPSVLTLTDLTPSFTLTGPPNSTVQRDNAVTMTVTTNNPGGYTVTVQPGDDRLGAPGRTDTIPIGRLGVRANGSGPFDPLAPNQAVTVQRQGRPSGPDGDAVSNDYQIQIPFVASDNYTTELDYIVTAQ